MQQTPALLSFQTSHPNPDGSTGTVTHFCVQRGSEFAWSLTSPAVASFCWKQLGMGQLYRRHKSIWGNRFMNLGMAMDEMLNKPFRCLAHEADKGHSKVNDFTSNGWSMSGSGFLLLLIFWTQHRAPAGPSSSNVITSFLRRTLDQQLLETSCSAEHIFLPGELNCKPDEVAGACFHMHFARQDWTGTHDGVVKGLSLLAKYSDECPCAASTLKRATALLTEHIHAQLPMLQTETNPMKMSWQQDCGGRHRHHDDSVFIRWS